MAFLNIANDPFRLMFSYLSVEDLGRMESTCKSFKKRISSDNKLWSLFANPYLELSSEESWRSKIITFKQKEKKIFVRSKSEIVAYDYFPLAGFHYLNNVLSFENTVHFVMGASIESWKNNQCINRLTLPPELGNFSFVYFDGTKGICLQTSNPMTFKSSDEPAPILVDTAIKKYNILIFDGNLKNLRKIYFEAKAYTCTFNHFYQNKIVIKGDLYEEKKTIYILNCDTQKINLIFQGNIIAFRKEIMWIKNDNEVVEYDILEEKIIAKSSFDNHIFSSYALIKDILIQRNGNVLIGYKIKEINEEMERNVEEIWRKEDQNIGFIIPPSDESPFFGAKDNKYQNSIKLYNAIDGSDSNIFFKTAVNYIIILYNSIYHLPHQNPGKSEKLVFSPKELYLKKRSIFKIIQESLLYKAAEKVTRIFVMILNNIIWYLKYIYYNILKKNIYL